MKRALNRNERTCADGALSWKMMALMSGMFGVLAVGLAGADPGWWSSRGAVNSNPPNDYAYINEGQLKAFTAAAKDEMDARLPDNGGGGSGPALSNLVYGWQQDYEANGRSTNDYLFINAGQLKTIGNMVYGQLAADGYTGLYPSWLHQNTNSDNAFVNIGQLKEVFNFDLSAPAHAVSGLTATASNPGEIDLNWTAPAVNNATSIVIQYEVDGGTTWTTLATLSDPTLTGYAVTTLPPGQYYFF